MLPLETETDLKVECIDLRAEAIGEENKLYCTGGDVKLWRR